MTAEAGHKVGENVFWGLVAGPILGLVYVIALPFIAIGTVAAMVGSKVVGGMINVAGNLVSFGWRPLEAHLAGKKKERKRDGGGR